MGEITELVGRAAPAAVVPGAASEAPPSGQVGNLSLPVGAGARRCRWGYAGRREAQSGVFPVHWRKLRTRLG